MTPPPKSVVIMKCRYPVETRSKDTGDWINHPCGQCIPCRVTRRNEWTIRILLEMRLWKYNYFLTLTYDEEHLPDGGNLNPKDLRNYWKRLRKYGITFRYFACGEYGEKFKRPHYHAIIFTNDEISFGNPKKVGRGVRARQVYPDCPFYKIWRDDKGNCLGIVDIVPVLGTPDAIKIAKYVAGYVVKKLTTKEAIYNETGQKLEPEFARMSRKPGIGFDSADTICAALARSGCVPKWIELSQGHRKEYEFHMLRYAGRLWPISRTFRDRLIKGLGGDLRSDLQRALQTDIKLKRNAYSPDYQARLNEKEKKEHESAVKAQKEWARIKARNKL